MHILVTNDDGITAPGLLALAQEMRKIGQVSVLAPDRNWSASGHVKTLDRPLRVRETLLADGTPAFTSDGAPSDCVALALLGLFSEKIDMVVSGINPNGNFGHDVTYSGTVTAAMEGAIAGLPSIAVSVEPNEPVIGPLDYGPTARIARRVAEQVIAHGLPERTLLNVNVPYLPEDQIRGILVTRMGLRIYRDLLVRREDPRGRPYYWIGGEAPTGVPDEGTDFGAFSRGYVSVTPLQLDLTSYTALEAMESWDWGERA
ncbi:MAG TPA: 5'/3'-nucleotidase SurE [Anaerolineaceae bacterium]|nr:5'/3'-nucleotidase SurE [Anaerolineaceae bacterium]